jgi:uncharacterized repeat protein (TIGR01451 family)
MMKQRWLSLIVPLVAALAMFCASPPTSTQSSPTAQGVEVTVDEVIASGFVDPVQVTHAGDGSGRLFVVEQYGTVKVIDDGGDVLPKAFLDVSHLTNHRGEQGLLGIAFHPDYETNGYCYVNYTRASDGATVVARYTVSANDPNRADPDSATEVITIPQPASNHNGGQVLFGPDGYLYVGMGDGGAAGDPLDHAQDPTTLLGALLRLDVDGGSPYAVPPDNPYVGREGRDEIWAIGLRNPWRFSFDRATGDLYIGDVGQNAWEEISFQASGTPGGVNFGWDCKEGTHDYEYDEECPPRAQLTDPIAEYGHDVGRSVTGGFVYRGTRYPALQGRYFYADYITGRIWSVVKENGTFSEPELELDADFNVSGFGEDEAGELYVTDWNGGTVRRLADAHGPAPNLTSSYKAPSTPGADPGARVEYTLALVNQGGAVDGTLHLTDTVPAGLSYVAGSLGATSGTVDDGDAPTLRWQGPLAAQTTVTVTYAVDVTGAVTGSLVNRATLEGPAIDSRELAAALFVPRSLITSTMEDFFLPGTQPNALEAEIPPSVDCDTCHSEPIYDRWRGTMMSQSGRDPLVWAALRTANADAPSSGDYCLRCHAPKGWLEGRSHPADGGALTGADLRNGVACGVCHRMVDPRPTGGELVTVDAQIRSALTATVPSDYVGSATLVVDPQDRRRGPFPFDPDLPYHTAYRTDFLGQQSESIIRSRLCGTCHDLDNPLLSWDEARGEYWPNAMAEGVDLTTEKPFPLERTYSEWLNSAYPDGVHAPRFAGEKPDGTVAACQDCHLQRITGSAADPQFDPVPRECGPNGCLPEHMMVGGNAWMPELLQDPRWRLNSEGDAEHLDVTVARAEAMLRQAATMTVTLTPSGTGKRATVRVTNEAGHKLPTGYPEGRQMWIHLRAYDAGGALVYESGAYDPATGLDRGNDAQVYEVKQGITPALADHLGVKAGDSFHFVLNNTVVKDNRIPPRGYTVAGYDQPGLRPVGATYADGQHWDEATYDLPSEATRVLAVLYYQTASKEYVDFLEANGGVEGETLGQLWEESPSPPVRMTSAFVPANYLYLPLIVRGDQVR